MNLHRIVLVGVSSIVIATIGLADSTADWQPYTDKVLRVKFRYPKEWKTNPGYYDRTYFEGSDGSVQLGGSGGDTPQRVCQQAAEHVVKPFGTHPTIRSLTVQGQPACLVWPSKDQESSLGKAVPPQAELVVEFPHPVEIKGNSYGQLTLYADTNHIMRIIQTLRFIGPTN